MAPSGDEVWGAQFPISRKGFDKGVSWEETIWGFPLRSEVGVNVLQGRSFLDKVWQIVIHTYLNKIQCQGDLVTKAYQERKVCENVTSSCWIPQAENIVDRGILSALPICDTLEKYTCMLKTMKDAKFATLMHCQRSCNAESYKVLSRTADIEPFTRVWEIIP